MPNWNPHERELAMAVVVYGSAIVGGVLFAVVLSLLKAPTWVVLLLTGPFLLGLRWAMGYLQEKFPK